MNRNQLVEAVADRVGDRRTAVAAVEAVLETVTRTVSAGEKVSLFGFGVFEKVERAARTARNPSTGASISLPARAVPRFRPGQALKDAVNGGRTSATAVARAEPAPEPSADAAAKDTGDRPEAGRSKTKGKDAKGKTPKGKAPKSKDAKGKDAKAKAKGKSKSAKSG